MLPIRRRVAAYTWWYAADSTCGKKMAVDANKLRHPDADFVHMPSQLTVMHGPYSTNDDHLLAKIAAFVSY